MPAPSQRAQPQEGRKGGVFLRPKLPEEAPALGMFLAAQFLFTAEHSSFLKF